MPLKTVVLSLALVFLRSGLVLAGDEAPSIDEVGHLEQFIHQASPTCRREPARRCVDLAWRFADTNDDGYWSDQELNHVRVMFPTWMKSYSGDLNARELTVMTTALALIDMIGFNALMIGFDEDHDGLVSQSELLTDVQLDERPLAEVLADPQAVDRDSFAHRFGTFAPIVRSLFP
jgi:Ca2+-binding EF-hand superfamily protein